ncbi:rCG54581 [Rattus norvegicus]|uniref:RCG54581 n=1 Tax=Rattus norvegicus TaxID=10116 RepID=A6J8W6_RAT|nr:rCG54581 [Rattus norvegicus]
MPCKTFRDTFLFLLFVLLFWGSLHHRWIFCLFVCLFVCFCCSFWSFSESFSA